MEDDKIRVASVPTDENPADLFTKFLSLVKFDKFVRMISGL